MPIRQIWVDLYKNLIIVDTLKLSTFFKHFVLTNSNIKLVKLKEKPSHLFSKTFSEEVE